MTSFEKAMNLDDGPQRELSGNSLLVEEKEGMGDPHGILPENSEDLIESLFYALEEITDYAVKSPYSEESLLCVDDDEFCKILETPLENFHNVFFGHPCCEKKGAAISPTSQENSKVIIEGKLNGNFSPEDGSFLAEAISSVTQLGSESAHSVTFDHSPVPADYAKPNFSEWEDFLAPVEPHSGVSQHTKSPAASGAHSSASKDSIIQGSGQTENSASSLSASAAQTDTFTSSFVDIVEEDIGSESNSGSSLSSSAKPPLESKVLPPCRVCAQPASGLHYGVNTCEACKGFFRRSIVRTLPYKCKGNGNCKVRGSEKRICAACRYSRCLAVGMSPEAIKTGRYTHEKRTKDTLEVQMLQTENTCECPHIAESDLNDLVAGLLESDKHVLSNTDVPDEIIEQKSRQVYENYQLYKETFGLQVLSTEEYEEIYRTTGIDVDGRKGLIEFYANSIERHIKGYVRFAKGIPYFKNLSVNDQANLLKMSRVEFWYLGAYRGFKSEYGTFYSPNGIVYNPQQHLHVVGQEFYEYQFRMADSLKKLDITKEELVVLKAICLTFSDRCELEEPKKVEKIQHRLLKSFYLLLQRRHANPSRAFTRAMDKLVALRDMTELSMKSHSRSLVLEVLKTHPMLMEVIVH